VVARDRTVRLRRKLKPPDGGHERMKWFKHMTASSDDEKLAALVGEGGQSGLAAYGAYWRFLEIIASQMEGKSPSCSVSYPVWRWSQKLFVRKSYLCSVLSELKKRGLLVIEGDPNVDESIIVKAPNLLKYRDEYSKKSGQSPKNIPPRTEGELDTDKELEEESTKDIPSSDGESSVNSPRKETKLEIAEQEEEIYKAYPRHVGRGPALKAIRKAVERLEAGTTEHPSMSPQDARRWLWKRASEYAVSLDGSAPERAEFLPHPSTWFNQERYFDDTKEWNRIRAGGNTHVKRNGAIEREAANFAFLQPDISSEPADNRAYQGSNGAAPNHQGPGPERIDLGGLDRTIEPVRS